MDTAHLPAVAYAAEVAFDVLKPFLVPTIMAFGWFVVAEMKRRGYQATYATALVRAVGSGLIAAQQRGVDPFSSVGRQIVAETGTQYLEHTVGDAATALGIAPEDHAVRVTAQLGLMQAQSPVLSEITVGEPAPSVK